ncbi:hypothetical protein GOP47_0026930 [Adiantum capillus-veneris]|nr:hypothetical protein GOP47_0026930 [Adiantum capillus-veneris]
MDGRGSHHLGRKPLVRRYTRSIVQGLEYLHLNGIVHCDIKAQNILIGSSGVKIADFGAAKRIGSDHEEGSASESELKGTPLWMAPEVVQGVEQRFPSEIWSLGCTVVELLLGCPPWGHMSDIAAALYKLGCSEEDPPLPEDTSDGDFVLHCLQRDPKARWTASELLQHPFLSDIGAEDDIKHEQLSPRSTLDFFQSEASDFEDTSDSSSLCFLQYSAEAERPREVTPTSTVPSMKRPFLDEFDCEEREWITVKRAARLQRQRKTMPFMKSGYVHVRKGCNVNLDSAEFLKNRKAVG